jgi:hypothetical protein
VSFLDDDEDDDDGTIQPPAEGVIDQVHARGTTAPPLDIAPSVMIARIDHTPVRPRVPSGSVPVMAMPHTPSGGVRQLVPRASTIPPPITSAPDSPTMIAPAAAFPIAPREWRHENKVQAITDPREPQTRRLIIGGLIAIATIAVIALATGGTRPSPAAIELAPEPVESPPVIDMKVEPARPIPAPAPTPIVAPPAAAQPASPPPPAPTPTKPAVTPPARPAPSETHHHHAAPPPAKPADPKPHPTAPPKYDPNSALPPP